MKDDDFPISRRRHPRLEVDGPYLAHDLTHGHWVRLCNISEGGFQTEAQRVATVGEAHTFRARLRDGQHVVLQALAVHCHVVNEQTPRCLVGWQLIEDATSTAAVRALIDDITTLAPGMVTSHDSDSAWAFQTAGSDGIRMGE